MRASKPPLHRALVASFGLLVGGGVLVAAVVLSLTLPFLISPRSAFLVLLAVLVVVVVVEWTFGNWLLRARLVRPVEQLVADLEHIAEGDHDHRVRSMPWSEFEAIRTAVNTLADRLVQGQQRLAGNVASLDRTNRELVATRDQLLQSARLASVGTLAAGIAHEVGNPLGAVLGYVDVAVRRAERSGGDTELLDAIRAEAKRIDHIVRSLLDYARPDPDAETASIDVTGVLFRVRDLLEKQGRLDRVTSRWTGPDGESARVILDPRALEQVLVNLVLNALDAVSEVEEPEIRVSVGLEEGGVHRLPHRRDEDPPGINYMHRRRVSRDNSPGGIDTLFTAPRQVVIRVVDNGPGISPEIRSRIFDPFFTTKEPGSGTGLGLSICARLVEGMGGRIEADETEGGGAMLLVRLPSAAALEGEEDDEAAVGRTSQGDTAADVVGTPADDVHSEEG